MPQFVPFFQGDSDQLTPQGQELIKLAGKYGANTNVIPTPDYERQPGGLGFMSFLDPQNVRVDPTQAGVHTAAHEIFHSSFPTDIGRLNMQRSFEREQKGPFDFMGMKADYDNRTKVLAGASQPARLRYIYETDAVPVMIEEASAQGGARAFTDQLGFGNIDQGYPVPGGFIKQTTSDGQVDSLAYPLMYRDQGINKFMLREGVGIGGGLLDGQPLGIGIDPRFSPETREEYYRIVNNARPRVQREFNRVYTQYR